MGWSLRSTVLKCPPRLSLQPLHASLPLHSLPLHSSTWLMSAHGVSKYFCARAVRRMRGFCRRNVTRMDAPDWRTSRI